MFRKRKKPEVSDEQDTIEIDQIVSEPEEPEQPAKMKYLDSTQMWSPVKDIKDGIVITKDGRYVQILEFSPINFDLRSNQEKDTIAKMFGSAIRIFPNRFQIKILSRSANVESHIRLLREYQRTETNPQCYRMQEESIQQIINSSRTGVSKRFFLSFEYQGTSTGIRRPSWAEIRTALSMQSNQIITHLAHPPCNNAQIGKADDTDHIMGIMHDCFNRAEAELKTIETKIWEVVTAYHMEGKLTENGMTIPINDFFSPQSIRPDISPSFLVVDGKYHAYGFIPKHKYATRCVAGWMSVLANLSEGFDIDIFVEKQSSDKVKQKLTHSMNLTKASMSNKDETAADFEDMSSKLASGKYIRAGLSNDQDFMYFGILISVIAPSEEVLKEKIEWLQNYLVANDLGIRMLNFQHDLAFRMSLPLCCPEPSIFKRAARNILSSDFGAAYPFTSYEINDQGGVMIGINKENYTPLFINFFDQANYSNGNTVIFGSPGAGKSYLLQCMALRLRQQQVQTIIIAPYKGHEFRRPCAAVGGQFVFIAAGSRQNINILEIRKHDKSTQEILDGKEASDISLLDLKISQVRIFFDMIVEKGLTTTDSSLLEEALRAAYRRKGITRRNKSLVDPAAPWRFKEMPILGDLYKELQLLPGAERLLSALYMFVEGSARSFNAPTNVNLDNPYVVIDVSECTKELLPVAIFIATDFVSDLVKADRTKKKAVIWDELHRLVGPGGTEDAAEYVMQCWKVFRGYRAICIAATQNSTDFLSSKNGDFGRNILDASKLKVLMKVENMDALALANILNLSSNETDWLQYFDRGEALLIANRNHARIKVVASETEDMLITTDPEQLERIKQQILQEQEDRGWKMH